MRNEINYLFLVELLVSCPVFLERWQSFRFQISVTSKGTVQNSSPIETLSHVRPQQREEQRGKGRYSHTHLPVQALLQCLHSPRVHRDQHPN